MDPYGRQQSRPWEILPVWLYMTSIISAYNALQCFTPSLAKQIMYFRYSNAPWQERTGLATRQLGAFNALLAIVQIHAGLNIHTYGAYNVGIWASLVVGLHFVSERMCGTVKGGSLIPAEIAAFVTFVWMCVQREKYVVHHDMAAGQEPLMHPTQGGPYYPDKGMVHPM